jgi:hypothetical protein
MNESNNLQVLPFYHDPEYKSSFREVIYFGKIKNNRSVYDYIPTPCIYDLVDHKDFRVEGTRFKEPTTEIFGDNDYLAFGILINIYNTRILPIDIDKNSGAVTIKNIELLLQDDRFTGADIINSSADNWHVMVGIKEFTNIRHILPFIPNICQGYVSCCRDRREAVLRVSQKFFKNNQGEPPTYYYGVRKNQENYHAFIPSVFTFPESNLIDPLVEKKRTVRLRV